MGRKISCTVYSPDITGTQKPLVVYLNHLPSERLGELEDETLIKGFLDRGMLVMEVDYEGDPGAVAPQLLPEIDRWYSFGSETKEYPVDPDWIYIIPAGYAIDRKVRICELRDRPVDMDVIYPSGNSPAVPLVLQISSTKERGKWINQRAYYIYGLLTTGYAGAIMDWNGTGSGLVPKGDVFPEKRAARLFRARARDWNLSGKLGVTGHSKGSGRAGKAALINEGNWEELRKSSSLSFMTPDDPPLFLSVGAMDREFRVNQMKRMAAKCEEVGLEYRFILQEGMGHMYNPNPEVIEEIFSFFDKYLK